MLEHKIQEAFSHATPDVWEQIQEKCEAEAEQEPIVPITKHKKNTWVRNAVRIVACVALLGAGAVGGFYYSLSHYYQSHHVVASVLSLGQHAGINLVVNEEGTVLEVKALNDDNRVIINNWNGYALEDAINEIVAILKKYNYLENTTLIIGIEGECESSIQRQMWETVRLYMEDRSVHVEIVEQEKADNTELRKLVETYRISFDMAEYVQKALAITSLYTIEELITFDSNMRSNICNLGNSRKETLSDGTVVSNEGALPPWTLAEHAYNYLIEQGMVIDRFNIEYHGTSYSPIDQAWISFVLFYSEVKDESEIKMEYHCEINSMTGEVLSYEERVSEESIKNIVLQDAYADERYVLGELARDFSVKVKLDLEDYSTTYRVTLKTENYWVHYKLDMEDGTILSKVFIKRT